MKRGIMLAAWLLIMVGQSVWAKTVVVTLPPLGALVAPFLAEEDRLVVLLTPGTSPHGFEFRPSQRMAVTQADVLISVGTPVDVWANDAFAQAQTDGAKWLRMADSAVKHYRKRVLAAEAAGQTHASDHDHDHHGREDGHVWLSPDNAAAFLQTFARTWGELNGQASSAAPALLQALQTQVEAIDAQLTPVRNQPYLVLHDAYQYFEQSFGLNFQGAIQLSPMIRPGVRHVMRLRDKIQSKQIRCVFKDRQFPERQVRYVIDELPVRLGTLDPLGHGLWPDASAIRADEAALPYNRLLQSLADGYSDCLGGQ
ncbi:MAG: zinc ABC transporter substrate-binding protein [Hydrogenovibrio sp.]|uniref:metal ABC transporter solute-binding protein, Zn/Mn family n=1 Tax=Hydrogenovibrio sp. TaxID=2065821 RepID=UPI002870855C|nr:zinc ABC transporter substrate-binding protein [Hydrogenovibrio sp.]MDR9499618.1 zinc ABC transporter substrate-binding protein [Hydrogenovibrio sp.]